MLRVFDFKCEKDHVTEHFISDSVREVRCPVCGNVSHRMIATPRSKLEGITGAFPTAYDRWAKATGHTEDVAPKIKRLPKAAQPTTTSGE